MYRLQCVHFFATIKVSMTNYPLKPLSTLSSIAAHDAREQRRRVAHGRTGGPTAAGGSEDPKEDHEHESQTAWQWGMPGQRL